MSHPTDYCGLLCMGGSERRKCPCRGPFDCEMRTRRADFVQLRENAVQRMVRHIRNAVSAWRAERPQ